MLELITLATISIEAALGVVLAFRHYGPEASHDEAK